MRTILTLLVAATLTGCAASNPAASNDGPASPTAAEAPATNVTKILTPDGTLPPPAVTANAHAAHQHDTSPAAASAGYTCPHHPEVVSDKPGMCPKCNMKLQATKALAATPAQDHPNHAQHGETPTSNAAYTCPHHPEVVSDKPGMCPKCNMKLQAAQAPAAKSGHGHAEHGHSPASAGTPATKATYTCPHHPEVVSDKPGMCPKCNMKLQAAKAPAATQPAKSAAHEHGAHGGGQ